MAKARSVSGFACGLALILCVGPAQGQRYAPPVEPVRPTLPHTVPAPILPTPTPAPTYTLPAPVPAPTYNFPPPPSAPPHVAPDGGGSSCDSQETQGCVVTFNACLQSSQLTPYYTIGRDPKTNRPVVRYYTNVSIPPWAVSAKESCKVTLNTCLARSNC